LLIKIGRGNRPCEAIATPGEKSWKVLNPALTVLLVMGKMRREVFKNKNLFRNLSRKGFFRFKES